MKVKLLRSSLSKPQSGPSWKTIYSSDTTKLDSAPTDHIYAQYGDLHIVNSSNGDSLLRKLFL